MMRYLLLLVSIALCITGCMVNQENQSQKQGTLIESVMEEDALKEHIITEGEGSSYRLLQNGNEEVPLLELAAGQDGRIIYRDQMLADISSTVNFKLQFLSTQGTGRFVVDGVDADGNVIAGIGWVVTGDLPKNTKTMKWVDSRYSINFIGSWIDTYYNVKVMFDKELGHVDYSKIANFRFYVEASDGQHALIARRDLFDDHSKSLHMIPLQNFYQVDKDEWITIQAILQNRSQQVIDSAGVELVMPYGYGLVTIEDTQRINEYLQPGEKRVLTWKVKANRADIVNLNKPWQIFFKINGVVEEESPVEVSINDREDGRVYYVLTEDLEPADSAGYSIAWGNQDGWLNPEELTVQMISKAEKMNQIADRYGAKWTHYIALPILKAAAWAEEKAPKQGWKETIEKVKNSVHEQTKLGHAYALHMHMDYDPYISVNLLSFNKERNGFWGNHLLHGWANLLPEEGEYDIYQSRVGSLYAYQSMLEEMIGNATMGQSLTARAGSFDFGDGAQEEMISTRAYQKAGYLASSDADGNIQGYTSADYGNEIYFASKSDINAPTKDLQDVGLVEFRLTPKEFIAYEKGNELDWNQKVDQGMNYFVGSGKVMPGVHAIVGFTHAFFMMGNGDWRSLEGGHFDLLNNHLSYVEKRYVKPGLLRFATADELVEAYLDYYTPQLLAVYGRILDENLLTTHYEIKLLGKDIPVNQGNPLMVKVKYPLWLREKAYKIIVLKEGKPIKIQDFLPTESNEIEFLVDDKNATYSMRIYHNEWIYRLFQLF